MKIYKYRDFSSPSEDEFDRLEDSVHRLLVWCARPDTLNDPQEFVWQCDYTPTPATPALLAGVLVKARGRTNTDAQGIAAAAIQNGRLEGIAKPVFEGMIEQCRNEISLACFGATVAHAWRAFRVFRLCVRRRAGWHPLGSAEDCQGARPAVSRIRKTSTRAVARS
jgi:hypothetical protein